jgi:hypothetical protein
MTSRIDFSNPTPDSKTVVKMTSAVYTVGLEKSLYDRPIDFFIPYPEWSNGNFLKKNSNKPARGPADAPLLFFKLIHQSTTPHFFQPTDHIRNHENQILNSFRRFFSDKPDFLLRILVFIACTYLKR